MSNLPIIYTVTLTDLGSYTADIAANPPEEAMAIAKEQLWVAFRKPLGFKITKRETDAAAGPSTSQPPFVHSITTLYKAKCAMMLPATTEAEAKEHFRRLIHLNGPVEFFSGEESFTDFIVEQTIPDGGSTNA